MSDVRDYGRGDRSKWSDARAPGCNDNDDPDHDNTVTLTVPDRRPATDLVTITATVERQNTDKLRALAGWYRAFAERAGSLNVWEQRLRTSEDLDEEANRIERLHGLDDAPRRQNGMVLRASGSFRRSRSQPPSLSSAMSA